MLLQCSCFHVLFKQQETIEFNHFTIIMFRNINSKTRFAVVIVFQKLFYNFMILDKKKEKNSEGNFKIGIQCIFVYILHINLANITA